MIHVAIHDITHDFIDIEQVFIGTTWNKTQKCGRGIESKRKGGKKTEILGRKKKCKKEVTKKVSTDQNHLDK